MHTYCFSVTKNILNYIGVKYLKSTQVTFLYFENDQDQKRRYLLKNYLMKNGYKTINFKAIDSNTFETIDSNAAMILPPLYKAKVISIYEKALNHNFKKIFIERDGDIFSVEKNQICLIPDDDVDLSVRDFIAQSNGKIIQTNTKLFSKKAANDLLDYILSHIDTMTEILKRISPMKRDIEYDDDYNLNPFAVIDVTKMSNKQLHVYLGALRILEDYKLIRLSKGILKYNVEFYDLRYKDYFSKSGTWLEHYTQRILESIDTIDDVNSSVMFVWDEDGKVVKNELDIMAVIDNQLIAISCKDTIKLVDDYLYELESHSDSLGSDDAIKIIVTTSNLNPHIKARGELLDVNIINSVLDKDKFRKSMLEIIKKYKNT